MAELISALHLASSQKKEVLRGLQEETFFPIVIATCLLGMFLAVFVTGWVTDPMKVALIGLDLILTSLLAFFNIQNGYLWSMAIIFVGWILASCLGIFWFPTSPLSCLLVLPVTLSAWLIDRRIGLGICLLNSIAILPINHFFPGSQLISSWVTAALVSWGVLFMSWLLLHSLDSLVLWSWKNYYLGQQQLNQVREHQGELNQAMKDLTDTNLQIARLNQLLNAERQRAEEAERVKTEFTANVSHELRTPLNMIIGFSEAILNAPAIYGTRLPPALLADIAAIYRNSQHLTNLINDVLDISQIEARRMTINRDWYSMADIIQEASQSVQPLLESRGLFLQTCLPSEMSSIYCDRTRIRQVLLNLLSNAGRFTESGGITIEVGIDEKQVTVTVTDTGPGIAEADLSKLFEPFHQLDGSLRRKHGGSGLGLNISRRFVELHDGRMGVRSQIGTGSSFWFTLPIKPDASQANTYGRWIGTGWEPRSHSKLTPRPQLAPRMIILEPRDLLEEIARRYLDDVQIESVSDPAEANARLAEQPAQVILVRGETPEQVSNWVQALQPNRFQTPIVAFNSPSGIVEDSLGVVSYLLKPITSKQLLEAVKSIDKPVRSILLVDDDPETLQLFTRILSSRPQRYRVLQASSGQEALELLRSRQPDLMLLDLVMPGMDGYAVLTEMIRDSSLKHTPVIILSATDPSGQPIHISSFSLTRVKGLSIPEFLQCALALSQTLLPGVQNLV